MIRMLLRLSYNLRRLYWRTFNATTVGVRAIIVNRENQVLLVKHRYQDGWYLPGGKVEKGETVVQALERELSQEVGVVNFEINAILGVYSNFFENKNDHVIVFLVKDFHLESVSHFEIEQSSFFDFHSVPETASPGTKRRLGEYQNNNKPSYNW